MLSAVLSLGALGLFSSLGLGLASKKFAVEIDPRVEAIIAKLPGANCGGCGLPGCSGYAAAIIAGKAEIGICPVCNAEMSKCIAEIMGVEVVEREPMVAVVRCRGNREQAKDLFEYFGVMDCNAAATVVAGPKACPYGCLGLGTCARACPFGALKMRADDLPEVYEEKCTSCGICVSSCPRGIMQLIPESAPAFIACISQEKAKAVTSVCKVGCIGCGLCSKPKTTPCEAVSIVNNLPLIDFTKVSSWQDLQGAVDKCPTGAFHSHHPELKCTAKPEKAEKKTTSEAPKKDTEVSIEEKAAPQDL